MIFLKTELVYNTSIYDKSEEIYIIDCVMYRLSLMLHLIVDLLFGQYWEAL